MLANKIVKSIQIINIGYNKFFFFKNYHYNFYNLFNNKKNM
jgi:hypothetical protein